jgi:hypothetical protein
MAFSLITFFYILLVTFFITFRLPKLRFPRDFSSVVRQMPGYNSQSGARPALPKLDGEVYVFMRLFYVSYVSV